MWAACRLASCGGSSRGEGGGGGGVLATDETSCGQLATLSAWHPFWPCPIDNHSPGCCIWTLALAAACCLLAGTAPRALAAVGRTRHPTRRTPVAHPLHTRSTPAAHTPHSRWAPRAITHFIFSMARCCRRLCAYQKFLTAAFVRPGSILAMALQLLPTALCACGRGCFGGVWGGVEWGV